MNNIIETNNLMYIVFIFIFFSLVYLYVLLNNNWLKYTVNISNTNAFIKNNLFFNRWGFLKKNDCNITSTETDNILDIILDKFALSCLSKINEETKYIKLASKLAIDEDIILIYYIYIF